jgi:hypothetical protein
VNRHLISAAVLLTLIVGCGDSGNSSSKKRTPTASPQPTETATATARNAACRTGRAVAVNALEGLLTQKSGTELVRVFHVRVRDVPSEKLDGFSGGVYVVSAQREGKDADDAVLSWAVNKDLLIKGGGRALPLGTSTQKLSKARPSQPPDSQTTAYAKAISGTAAFRVSRSCVRAG